MEASEFELLGKELREDLSIDQLLRIEDPCVVFEFSRLDSDKVRYWVYTVGGWLDGAIVGGKEGGALVGGQTIIVHGKNRKEADAIAYEGLVDTIAAENRHRAAAMRAHLDSHVNPGIIAHGEILSPTKH